MNFIIVDFIWVWSCLYHITKIGVMFAYISKLVHCLGNVVMTYRRYYGLKPLLGTFLILVWIYRNKLKVTNIYKYS